jgi:hypothetical protein
MGILATARIACIDRGVAEDRMKTVSHLNPQARGRDLARQGRQLWSELGSVKLAAAELMNRNREVSSLQAFRYAAGLSQDQAAARYNEMTGYQTSLGGTTVNAWETWARARGSGSPPPFSSLVVLAQAYGRGPLGVVDEPISPGDLVAEAYERLTPEDQISLRRLGAPAPFVPATRKSGEPVGPVVGEHGSGSGIIGCDFTMRVPVRSPGDNSEICSFPLRNPLQGQLLDLDWSVFGFGIERLARQIKNLGRRLDVDACFGVNEAGLVMATFLASAQFSRCPIGYLRCIKTRDSVALASASFFPVMPHPPTILICDFEVKQADVVGYIARELRIRYPDALLYFAVFGAMTKGSDLEVSDFHELTGAEIITAADFEAVFIAATMCPPGIEPPLELR